MFIIQRHSVKICCHEVLSIFVSIFLLNACSDQVDLYTGNKPTPVVYCLLDPMDSVQYVRLSRTFQANSNLPEVSPETDSTVWNIPSEIYLEEYSGDVPVNRYVFQSDTIVRKDSGFFPDDNLRLYSTSLKPKAGNDYRLYVFFPDLLKIVSGRITVHGQPEITDPAPLSIRKINFEPGQPLAIRWLPGLNTGVYEMIFRIHYRDSTAAGSEMRYADYSNGGLYNQGYGQIMETQMGGPAFFNAMRKQVPNVLDMLQIAGV